MKQVKIVAFSLCIMLLIPAAYYGKKARTYYCTIKAEKEWQRNFPRTIEYCDSLPHSDSLYIFIMAGQSNMAGRGFVEPQDTISNMRILTIDTSLNWVYAKEPLHLYEPKFAGLDCGISFANDLLPHLPQGASIAMVPCAIGSSSIEQWLANEKVRGVPLLDNFKQKVNYAEQFGHIKGILWHQGESDAALHNVNSYYKNIDSLIHFFRASVHDSIPILIGELGHYAQTTNEQETWDSLNTVIHNFEHHEHDVFVINTDSLSDKGDKTHFDSKSQRELGKRFSKGYINFISSEHYKTNHMHN